jgi:hypothetical protein
MRSLKTFSVLVASLCLVMPPPTEATWAQVDHATTDVTLRRLTEDGSAGFLGGAIKVENALNTLDQGNLDEAVHVGFEAAKDFHEARERFQAAASYIGSHKEVAAALDEYLKSVKYSEKATVLDIQPEKTPLWLEIRDVATKQGAAALFARARDRSDELSEKARSFFDAAKAHRSVPIKGAVLLRQLGEDLAFGAYVSAIFATTESSKPDTFQLAP